MCCSTLEARKELAVRELVSQYDECWPCLSAGSSVRPKFGRAACLLARVAHTLAQQGIAVFPFPFVLQLVQDCPTAWKWPGS